eukprot:11455791-Heterocapsa_arctica.AAC.1
MDVVKGQKIGLNAEAQKHIEELRKQIEPAQESRVRKEIDKIESSIVKHQENNRAAGKYAAGKKRSSDKHDVNKQAKQANNEVINNTQDEPEDNFIKEVEDKRVPQILNMLGIKNQEILGRQQNIKGIVGNANKQQVQKTVLKLRKGSEAIVPGVRWQGLPFWLAKGAASWGHDKWKPDERSVTFVLMC